MGAKAETACNYLQVLMSDDAEASSSDSDQDHMQGKNNVGEHFSQSRPRLLLIPTTLTSLLNSPIPINPRRAGNLTLLHSVACTTRCHAATHYSAVRKRT